MSINILIKDISDLNLYKWKVVQITSNSLLIFKTKYKYTDCIYIKIDNSGVSIRKERVFDNKYLDFPIERLLISSLHINKDVNLLKYIEYVVKI